MADVNSSIGTTIFVGPSTPDAADVLAFAAITWTQVNRVESVSEFGDQAGSGTFNDLSKGRTEKFKTARDAGDCTVVVAHIPGDDGQQDLIEAERSRQSFPIKVVVPDAADSTDTDSIFYFHAKVMSSRLNPGSSNDVLRRTFVLAITSEVFEEPSQPVSGG